MKDLEVKSNLNEDEQKAVKRAKTFSAKEFRQDLKNCQKVSALIDFLSKIKEIKTEDVILDYLNEKGNIQELLQLLEEDNTIPHVIILQIICNILLKLLTIEQCKWHESAFESCKYFLNNFTSIVYKMISLTSTSKERVTILKLLTAMSSFSSLLIKDILTQINFPLTSFELLTKVKSENKEVRESFIQFLTAILYDGHYHSLALLLDKKGMLTSILSGLQYDSADTVCFVLSAMKTNVLQNENISKTVKMRTFNTIVVKNIVNLYNWRGPENIRNEKEMHKPIQVNEVDKAQVNQHVHEFLLILCTTKHGIIFRDPTVGLGKRNYNPLMYTVLQSLEAPWEHSYASELVIKICVACPDLVKHVWKNLKQYLELRYSEKWLKVVKFIIQLVKAMNPNCLEPFIQDLNMHQLIQIIPILVSPLPILKTLLPENKSYEFQIIKYHCMSAISVMLSSLLNFLAISKKWLHNDVQESKLKTEISYYIMNNFPNGQFLFENWDDEDELHEYDQMKYLDVILNFFNLYESACPSLLDSLKFTQVTFRTFFDKIKSDFETHKIKIINLFLSLNPALFSIASTNFEYFLQFLFKAIYSTKTDIIVLQKFLRNTMIFETHLEKEVNVWINGIFSLKLYDENVISFLNESLLLTNKNLNHYSNIIYNSSKIKKEKHHVNLIDELLVDSLKSQSYFIKNNLLSPLFIGILEKLNDVELNKNLTVYLNYVIINIIFLQNEPKIISEIIKEYNCLPNESIEYFNSLCDTKNTNFLLPKHLRVFQKIDIFREFMSSFVEGTIQVFLDNNKENINIYPDLKADLLQMAIFCFSKLLNLKNNRAGTCADSLDLYINYLLSINSINIEYIFGCASFLNNFSILDNCNGDFNCCTKFLVNIIGKLKSYNVVFNEYLSPYCEKLANMLIKILYNPNKYSKSNIFLVLSVFKLNLEATGQLLDKISDLIENNNIEKDNILVLKVLNHCFFNYIELNENTNLLPLSDNICFNIFNYFMEINDNNNIPNKEILSTSILKYLKLFPHNINQINESFIISIFKVKEFHSSNADLLTYLFLKNDHFLDIFFKNIDDLIPVKGVLLPLLDIVVEKIGNKSEYFENALQYFYKNIKDTIHKALEKPHKVNQAFNKNFKGITFLIEKYADVNDFSFLFNKVQKYESTKLFHINFLSIIFSKYIDNKNCDKICNTILTFIHLFINQLKNISNEKTEEINLKESIRIFINYLDKILESHTNFDFTQVTQNESFKLLCKFCLKYGINEEDALLDLLNKMVLLFKSTISLDDSKLLLDMLTSHSEFLNVVLENNHKCKRGVMSLILVLCENWPPLMERSHVPILLAAYKGTLSEADVTTLTLLKIYEKHCEKTNFYDFKPYLWGMAAANHYTVTLDVKNSLFREPKISSVLHLLQEPMVKSTIRYYHLLKSRNEDVNMPSNIKIDRSQVYDLDFFFPLFNHLLSAENVVPTYHFTKSGALSLTIIGLSCNDKDVRAAACNILSRFYFHVEGRQTGKDNVLWLRFIEVICASLSSGKDFYLNNFASIFLAKSATILMNPNHVMYAPISNFLAAKPILNLSTIPELYTFLHSADVNFKDHRQFILELLADGLLSYNDFNVFQHSMAFKLFSELYTSCVSDTHTKILILNVILSLCKIPKAIMILSSHHSIIEFLLLDLKNNAKSADKNNIILINKLLTTFNVLLPNLDETFTWCKYLLHKTCEEILKSEMLSMLSNETLNILGKVCHLLIQIPEILDRFDVKLLDNYKDRLCNYWEAHGVDFVDVADVSLIPEHTYELRLLYYKLITVKRKL